MQTTPRGTGTTYHSSPETRRDLPADQGIAWRSPQAPGGTAALPGRRRPGSLNSINGCGDCNGQTDETCTPTDLETRLGWVSVDKVAGVDKSARRVQVRGSFEPVGTVKSAKLKARFGWLTWLFEGGK